MLVEVATKINLWWGVTTAWGTVLKGSSVREIEYHCLKCSTTFQKNTTRWEQASKHVSLQETVHISTTHPSYLQHPGNGLYPRSHDLCLIVKAHSRLGQVVLCKFILWCSHGTKQSEDKHLGAHLHQQAAFHYSRCHAHFSHHPDRVRHTKGARTGACFQVRQHNFESETPCGRKRELSLASCLRTSIGTTCYL